MSGAHLNPAVSIAFALRRDFPWRRVPGYVVVQLIGATLAALFLHAVINVSAMYGSNYPAHGYSDMAAFWMELILTMGLVSVILGTASGAQNVGIFGAVGVGGYIALAGLWGSPISGASMNPARTFGPDLVSTTFTGYWVYVAGPIAGAALAVVIAFVLRGPGWRQLRFGCGARRHLHRGLRAGEVLSRRSGEDGRRHGTGCPNARRLVGCDESSVTSDTFDGVESSAPDGPGKLPRSPARSGPRSACEKSVIDRSNLSLVPR